MMRIVVAVALVSGCMQQHQQVVAVRQDDCVLCHVRDYNATTVPMHAQAGYSEACAECHRTTSWQPALDGPHPDDSFPRASGPHGDVKCLECHDLDIVAASQMGANTNCIQCHPNSADQMEAHVGTLGPAGQSYAYDSSTPNFCLTCHPKGLAYKHIFPRRHHGATSCTTCHDRSAGPDTDGMNVTCFGSGCHSIDEENREHREVRNYSLYSMMYPANKHFCLECHERGKSD